MFGAVRNYFGGDSSLSQGGSVLMLIQIGIFITRVNHFLFPFSNLIEFRCSSGRSTAPPPPAIAGPMKPDPQQRYVRKVEPPSLPENSVRKVLIASNIQCRSCTCQFCWLDWSSATATVSKVFVPHYWQILILSSRYQETHPGLRNKPGFVQAPPGKLHKYQR